MAKGTGLEITMEMKHWKALDEKIKKLSGHNPRMAGRAARNAALGIAKELQDEISQYPMSRPEVRTRSWRDSGGFKTDKQRRWFFWALGEGAIQVPYQRSISGGLMGSWVIRRTRTGAILSNRKDYAIWVQHKSFQTKMHERSGWKAAYANWMQFFMVSRRTREILRSSVDHMMKVAGLGQK